MMLPQAAQTAALNHAGVQAGTVSEMKCERDQDDGRTIYEVEFRAGRMEYEYEVDAATGPFSRQNQNTTIRRLKEKPDGSPQAASGLL